MRILKTLLTLSLCVSPLSVFAEGDYDSGKLLSDTCTGCHGIANYNNVYPTYRVPRIGGQNKEYLIAALQEYKNGGRTHGTMNLQALSLNDQQIEDIAVYLAAQTEK